MKTIIIFILVIVVPVITLAQKTVTGKVVDIETKKSIKVAEITIEGTETTTTTNVLGFFQLVLDSIHSLTITSPGYETGFIDIPVDVVNFQIGLTRFDSTAVFDKPDESAEFPGGTDKMQDYLIGNFRIPPGDKTMWNEQGIIYVQFVIDKEGFIPPDQIRIIKGIHALYDAEVVRLVKRFPRWKPARKNNRPVSSRVVLPVQK